MLTSTSSLAYLEEVGFVDVTLESHSNHLIGATKYILWTSLGSKVSAARSNLPAVTIGATMTITARHKKQCILSIFFQWLK